MVGWMNGWIDGRNGCTDEAPFFLDIHQVTHGPQTAVGKLLWMDEWMDRWVGRCIDR